MYNAFLRTVLLLLLLVFPQPLGPQISIRKVLEGMKGYNWVKLLLFEALS